MPQKNTGMFGVQDLLDSRFQNVSVAEFGMNTIVDIIQADIAAHNIITQDLVGNFAAVTTDLLRLSGSSLDGDMAEVDEYGDAPTQKQLPGSTVGFPLRSFQYAVGWTRRFFLKAKVYDLAVMTNGAQKAHFRAIEKAIRKAIYGATNYTFRDFLNNGVSLGVKAFYNADGTPIPNGPNSEVFDGTTHTHYLASATLTTTALDSLINTVIEHGYGEKIQLAFNRTDDATIRALANFVPAADPRLILASTTTTPDVRLDIKRLDNRLIGYYGAAEVWIKPWAVANYVFACDIGSGAKPLAFREDQGGAPTGLYVAAEFDDYPLYARVMQAEFGVGVWNRGNGAVLQFNNSTYSTPSIT